MIKKKWLFLHFVASSIILLCSIKFLNPAAFLISIASLMIGYNFAISQMKSEEGEEDD